MISILAEGLPSAAVGFLFDVSLKAALLLLVATIATIATRRGSAAVRHRMWCLTFASLVLLPVFCVALPRWNVAILPAQEPRSAALENAKGTANPRSSTSATRNLDLDGPNRSLIVEGKPATETALEKAKAVAPTRSATELQTADAPVPQTGDVVWRALLSIWIVGALLVLVRQGIEIVVVRRLVRSCRPITDDGWNELLLESQAKLRLRRSVLLLQSDVAIVPMTCGVLRRVVLLPASSVDWRTERRRCVLLHELAHVKRFDVLFQTVARAACGFYWLNPLIWYAAARLRVERELACDDCVLAAGERASDYAEQLVEIARSCRTLRLAAGVAMARSSKLEERVVALLDRTRSHHLITERLSFGLALAAGLLLTVAAMLQPVARAAVIAESGEQSAKETVEESATAAERAATAEPTAGKAKSIRGRVSDPQGNPVRGAQIWARRLISADWQWRPVATTDTRGLFRFDVDPVTLAESLKSIEELSLRIHRKVPIALAASAAGFGFGLIELAGLTPEREELANVSLRLVKDVPVIGRILTVDGRPASGTSVEVGAIHQPDEATLDEYIRRARQGETREARSVIAGVLGSMPPGPRAKTLTDQDGRFAISGLGADRIVLLELRGPSIPDSFITVITRPVPQGEAERKAVGVIRLMKEPHEPSHYYAHFTHVSGATRILRGVVRDRQTGRPVSGVHLEAEQASAVTGANGRFELVGCPKAPRYWVKTQTPNSRYLPIAVLFADPPGLAPSDFKIDLIEGVRITGRVTDQRTGKPVQGTVDYRPLAPNSFFDRLGNHVDLPLSGGAPLDKDGTYELQAMPGPGFIAVRCPDAGYILPRIDLKEVNRILGGAKAPGIGNSEDFLTFAAYRRSWSLWGRWQFKALALIDPHEGAVALRQDLVLVPGHTISGRVVDPDGQPVRGVRVAGLGFDNREPRYEVLDDAQFTVRGVSPDEPRELLFFHPEKRLAAHIEIANGNEAFLTVRLQPCATVRGRVVSADGHPVPGKLVELHASNARRDAGFLTETKRAQTDKDGNFRIAGVIPDLDYRGRVDFKLVFSIKLKPAETYDAQTIRLAQKTEGREGPSATASGKTNASKPSSKKDRGSNLLKQIREASEPILAEMAEKHGYRLTPGQSIHRVAPPFDPIRMTYYRTGHPTQSQYIPAGPSAIAFRWEGKALHNWSMTFGGFRPDGYNLEGLVDAIQGIKSQQLVGPPELLHTPIPGDWVSRPGMSDETFAQALQAILQNELKLPIRLQFRTHRREVYVAKGLYRFVALPGQRGETKLYLENTTETMNEVQIFGGKQLVPNSGGGGGTGDFAELLLWLGRWIDMPIVDEVQKPPGQISWVQHENTRGPNKDNYDPALVLPNIEAQTGMHFVPEVREVKSLFVERGK